MDSNLILGKKHKKSILDKSFFEESSSKYFNGNFDDFISNIPKIQNTIVTLSEKLDKNNNVIKNKIKDKLCDLKFILESYKYDKDQNQIQFNNKNGVNFTKDNKEHKVNFWGIKKVKYNSDLEKEELKNKIRNINGPIINRFHTYYCSLCGDICFSLNENIDLLECKKNEILKIKKIDANVILDRSKYSLNSNLIKLKNKNNNTDNLLEIANKITMNENLKIEFNGCRNCKCEISYEIKNKLYNKDQERKEDVNIMYVIRSSVVKNPFFSEFVAKFNKIKSINKRLFSELEHKKKEQADLNNIKSVTI